MIVCKKEIETTKMNFTIKCNACNRVAKMIPIGEFDNNDYENISKITLEFKCICGNSQLVPIYARINSF